MSFSRLVNYYQQVDIGDIFYYFDWDTEKIYKVKVIDIKKECKGDNLCNPNLVISLGEVDLEGNPIVTDLTGSNSFYTGNWGLDKTANGPLIKKAIENKEKYKKYCKEIVDMKDVINFALSHNITIGGDYPARKAYCDMVSKLFGVNMISINEKIFNLYALPQGE